MSSGRLSSQQPRNIITLYIKYKLIHNQPKHAFCDSNFISKDSQLLATPCEVIDYPVSVLIDKDFVKIH